MSEKFIIRTCSFLFIVCLVCAIVIIFSQKRFWQGFRIFIFPNSCVIKAFLIILIALAVFGGLIYAKIYMDKNQKPKIVVALSGMVADTSKLSDQLKADSLYHVKQVLFKDSAVLIAVSNPDKSGTETYFDKKYKLNVYDNINMVYIFPYDSTKPLQNASLEDAPMAKGKKMGQMEQQWIGKFIDTTDNSCKPLKKYIQASLKNPDSYRTEMMSYQPESISKMRVVSKYSFNDSTGNKMVYTVSAVIDSSGNVVSVDKNP